MQKIGAKIERNFIQDCALRNVRFGSFASVLRCPPYVRLGYNFRSAGSLLTASP